MIKDTNDGGTDPWARPLSELDGLDWRGKVRHALRAVDPLRGAAGTRKNPQFPKERVPTTAEAGRRIYRAARHATRLWAADEVSQRGRDPRAIRQWRDVWTHPAVYRRTFSRWVGTTYANRQAVGGTSDRAEEASHRGPATQAPAPTWVPSPPPDAGGARGLGPGTMRLYAHGPPERFGHATSLRATESSELAQAVEAELIKKRGDKPDYVPEAVVRLEDLGWYLGGFLGSVLVWTHLALTETPSLALEDDSAPTRGGLQLEVLMTTPGRVLDGFLLDTWRRLEQMLRTSRARMSLPIPDLLRVPQEWCEAMGPGGRSELGQDVVLWQGTSGDSRRWALRAPPRGAGLPRWALGGGGAGSAEVRASLDESFYRAYVFEAAKRFAAKGEGKAAAFGGPARSEVATASQDPIARWSSLPPFLERMADRHAATLCAGGEFCLTERYLPLPEPPHPMTALFLPWSGLQHQGRKDLSEVVHRLGSLRTLAIHWLAISCLETGLAIEEWGRCWTRQQREEQREQGRLTADQKQRSVADAVMGGQSVPGWEDAPRRRLLMQPTAVLDPSGPMRRGHRVYADSGDPKVARIMAALDDDRMAASWFRIDRMTTAERLVVRGPGADMLGRWEDSGLEMPARLMRDLRRHRALRSVELAPLGPVGTREELQDSLGRVRLTPDGKRVRVEMWSRAVARTAKRAWTPSLLYPWPVSMQVTGVDLSLLDTVSLNSAFVVRRIWLERAVFPRRTWLRDVLAMPAVASRHAASSGPAGPAEGAGTVKNLARSPKEWSNLVVAAGARGSLMPSARLTLVFLAATEARYVSVGEPVAPAELARDILPGVPPPMAPQGMLRSNFVHYPNLSAISFRDHGLGDIPPGLLDLASRTQRAVPTTKVDRGKSGVRWVPPPIHYFTWDLSDNKIEDLSVPTLVSLVWFAHESRARMLARADPGARTPWGTPARPRVPELVRSTTLAINLWGNPVTRKVPRPDPGPGVGGGAPLLEEQHLLWGTYIDRKLAEVWDRISPKMQAQELRQQQEGGGAPSLPRNPAWIALQFWHANRGQVTHVVGGMIVSVRPDVFGANTARTYKAMEAKRYRWMI